MTRWWKLGLALLFTLSVGAGAFAREPLEPGTPVPPLVLRDGADHPVPLKSLLGPKGALVVFWASWSPRSAELLAFLSSLQPKYGAQGLTVLAVNAEHEALEQAQRDDLSGWYKGQSLPWPPYFDPKLDAFAALGVLTLPTSLYVGSDATVKAVYPGFPSGEGKASVVELVEKALGVWAAPVVEETLVPPQQAPKAGAAQRIQLARRLFERNQKRKAVEEFQRALQTDPDFAPAYAAAAFVAGEAGMEGEREGLVAALARRRAEPPFQEALGVALTALGRSDEARQVLRPLLDQEAPLVRGLLALAYCEHEKGDNTASRLVLEKLKAWPRRERIYPIDVSAWLAPDTAPEAQWKVPGPFFLKLLNLPAPLGFGLKTAVRSPVPLPPPEPRP